MMKTTLIAILMLIPAWGMAQSNWERPESKKKTAIQDNQENVKSKDSLYLAGAVPEVDGKVQYTLDVNIPGKSAQQIYDMVYEKLEALTTDKNQIKKENSSRIILVNKATHSIVATFSEWLVFTSNLLSLDRAEMDFVVSAECSDGKLHLIITRLKYKYEMERDPQLYNAEDIITDKLTISKDGTKLKKGYAKFRRHTVDRMNEILGVFKGL